MKAKFKGNLQTPKRGNILAIGVLSVSAIAAYLMLARKTPLDDALQAPQQTLAEEHTGKRANKQRRGALHQSDSEGGLALPLQHSASPLDVSLPSILVPFAESARGSLLRELLGEGPYATTYLASFLASEHVGQIAGGASTRDALVESFRTVLESNPPAVWSYVRTRTSQGNWEGFERERYLLVASAFEALPTQSRERSDALEWLGTLVGGDSGSTFSTGVALLTSRLGSDEEAEQVGHALLARREDNSEQALVVSLLSGPFPEAARRLSSSLSFTDRQLLSPTP
ncbi:MAG: hypothetical protein IOD12_04350 [Silvanigrellales bacterium]|nr:hypothetical protein [Silvanigrellales bacterium]